MKERLPLGWAGIDVGKGDHWICLIDEAGTTVWSTKEGARRRIGAANPKEGVTAHRPTARPVTRVAERLLLLRP